MFHTTIADIPINRKINNQYVAKEIGHEAMTKTITTTLLK